MSKDMKLIMERWDGFLNEAVDQEKLADVITKLKSIEGNTPTAGDLKFLVDYIARDIASGNALSKEVSAAAMASGVDLAADLAGVGLVKNASKFLANVAKRAKVKRTDTAGVLASLMFVGDIAATKNPILNIMNVHDAYEGSINPLLNGPFVVYAMEKLNELSDDTVLDSTWGTETMQNFLSDERSLETKPRG